MFPKRNTTPNQLHSHLAGDEPRLLSIRMDDDICFRSYVEGEDNGGIINFNNNGIPFPLLDHDDFTTDEALGKKEIHSFSISRKRQPVHEEDCYPVSFGNKLLLIFNFYKVKGKEDRKGSHRDVENLKNTYERKNFVVRSHKNLTKEKTERKLENYRNWPDLEKTSALVMVFMSHGDEKDPDSFLSYDGKSISMVNDIRRRFSDLNCPALKGKPKVMIGVFCRDIDRKNEVLIPPEREYDSEDIYCNDMLTIFSCAKGKESYRHEEEGNYFVQAFCKIINEYGDKYNMYRIFAETQNEMRKKRPEDVPSLEGYEPCMDPPLTFGTFYLA